MSANIVQLIAFPVTTASYGAASNCGTRPANTDNALSPIAGQCNGNGGCHITAGLSLVGGSDPWPGCYKQFSASYTCGGATETVTIGGTYGNDANNQTVRLSCID